LRRRRKQRNRQLLACPDPFCSDESMSPDARPVSLLAIFWIFFRVGLFSFGGGLSAWIHREMTVARNWLSVQDSLAGIALAQVLPGANVTNFTVYCGLMLAGTPGAAVALFALLLGPTVLVILFAIAYPTLTALPYFHSAMDGIAAGAVGLILRMGLTGAEQAVRRIAPSLALVATFVAVGILRWPLVPVVCVVAPASVAAVWPWKTADA
jgi:chromate transporter